MSQNYYDLLGVSRFSTSLQLKAAYDSKLAELTQNNQQDSPKAQQIKAAYAILSDRNKRWQYDTETFRTPKPKLVKEDAQSKPPSEHLTFSMSDIEGDKTTSAQGNLKTNNDANEIFEEEKIKLQKQESFSSNLEKYIRASEKSAKQPQKAQQTQSFEPFVVNADVPRARAKTSPQPQPTPEAAEPLHESHFPQNEPNIKQGRFKVWFIVITMLVGFYMWNTRKPQHTPQPPARSTASNSSQTIPPRDQPPRADAIVQEPAPVSTPTPLDSSRLAPENAVNATPETPVRVQIAEFSLKDSLIAQTMNQLYGADKYWSTYKCWRASLHSVSQTLPYCMKPLGASVVTVDGGEKLYFQTTGCLINGDSVSDDRTMCGPHAEPGAFGAVVLNLKTSEIIASSKVLPFPNGWGDGPGEPLQLVRLSSSGELGWLGQGQYMSRGEVYYSPVLFVPKGKRVINMIGNVPGSMLDESGNTTDFATEIRYVYTFDTSTEKEGYYPMRVKRITLEDEKIISSKAFRAYFDPDTLSYQCTSEFCAKE